MKLGIRPVILENEAEKICRLVEFQMLLGNSLSNEFPEMFRNCRFPNFCGILPLKLLLLRSRNVNLGSMVRVCGIDPLSLLFWIRTLVSEVQLLSDNGRVLVKLLLKRMNETKLFPLQMLMGVEPWSRFVETSIVCSNPLEPSFGGSVPMRKLLKTWKVLSFGSSPIP